MKPSAPADAPDVAVTAPAFDIDTVKQQARSHLANGPVTESYRGQRETVVALLNQCLATELDCVLRYRQHHFLASTIGGVAGFVVRDALLAHSQDELGHADRLARRVTELGGHARFFPEPNTGAVSTINGSLRGMLTEDLLSAEESHADVLADFLGGAKLGDL